MVDHVILYTHDYWVLDIGYYSSADSRRMIQCHPSFKTIVRADRKIRRRRVESLATASSDKGVSYWSRQAMGGEPIPDDNVRHHTASPAFNKSGHVVGTTAHRWVVDHRFTRVGDGSHKDHSASTAAPQGRHNDSPPVWDPNGRKWRGRHCW